MNPVASGRLAMLVMALALLPAPPLDQQQPAQAATDRTKIFTCGDDQLLPNPIPLGWTTLVLAGDSRMDSPCGTASDGGRKAREVSVITRGFRSQVPDERWRAAQAMARLPRWLTVAAIQVTFAGGQRGAIGSGISDNLGGFVPPPVTNVACNPEVRIFGSATNSRRWLPGIIFQMLLDRSVPVQKEAAYALAIRLADPALDPDVRDYAIAEAHDCYERRLDPEVKGLMLEAFGVARYRTDAERLEVEDFLVKECVGPPTKILGAVSGLEALFRQNPQYQAGETTRVRLRELVTSSRPPVNAPALDPAARIPRIALMALQATHDADINTLTSAAASGDWQIRRLAATQLNLAEPSQQSIGEQLDRDESFQVRYEVLGVLSKRAGQTGICAPLAAHLKDPSPIVVLRTMDLLVKACTDLDEAVATMTEWADELRKTEEATNWLRSSRALTSLARIRPDVAKSRLAAAVKHPAWQVRAAAATSTVVLADEAAAVDLADDSEPNVRTAALQALSRMQSTALNPAAINALQRGADYQLLRTAAIELKNVPEEVRDEATEALLGALRRLTDEESDTSRDTRVAIIERLAAVMRPERSTDLIPFASDYDSHVGAAARKAFMTLVGAPPADSPPRRRYPYQPTLEALANLPTEATIRVDGGSIILKFVPEVAPVTIARFAELATAGFYNNSTFFRAVPNFMVQGGSPGANDYSATSRFMREEVGPEGWHVRGAVAMSTRGGDTGDGQIFIDLVDLPRFDRDYTVFAYVTQGMEFVDRLLEGSKIVSISVK